MRRPNVLDYSLVVAILLQLIYAVSSASALETRQQSGLVTATDDQFLRWSAHQSTVAGNYLYIDGGIFSYLSSGQVHVDQSSSVLAVDLGSDWNNATLKIASTPKPNEYPKLSYGSLWYHQSENLIYFGFCGAVVPIAHANMKPPLTLWAFKPDNMGGGTFETIFGPNASIWATSNLTRPHWGLETSGSDKALVLGGLDAARVMGLPGMVRFDMNTRSFTNQSRASTGQPIQSGQMKYVPSFGPEGIFLAFGGETAKEEELVSFGIVPVFDPAAQTWYNQTTSGNTPKGRRDFCVAGLASNNDTYEIFLYGGLGGAFDNDDGKEWYDTPYDTISILTLPAFHWVDVTYDRPVPRSLHTCDSVGGSQILIFGGTDYAPPKFSNFIQRSMSSEDPFNQGIGIFDLSNLEWADHYAARPAPYEQSDPVKQYYAMAGRSYVSNLGSPVATLMKATHFNHTVAKSSPGNSTATPSSSDPLSKSTNTGAIAGGVIGGIVFLGIVTVVAFITLRRRRRVARQRAELDSTNLPLHATAEKRSEMDGETSNPELPSNQMMRSELPEQYLPEMG